MTATDYRYAPSPERAWQIAEEGGLRLNEQSKVQALIHAAICAENDFRFIGDRDNWLVIRRLMHPSVRGDDFGLLISAVAEGNPTRMREVAERLVTRS